MLAFARANRTQPARFDQNELISHMEFRVKRAPRIDAEITVPGDKSISHRAVIIAALSNGICVLRGFLPSEDCLRTVQAMRALGIKIEQPEPDMLVVHGKKRVLTPPAGEIDCGNSATTMRLLAGLLAGQSFDSRLVGASTLAKRPMERVITPLREMGALITAEGPNDTAPLRITGAKLRGIEYSAPIASAQVKSALLLAGLFAKGKTTVHEPFPSRNHTELMLNYFLVRTVKDETRAGSAYSGIRLPSLAISPSRATFPRPRFGWSPRARNRAVIYSLGRRG